MGLEFGAKVGNMTRYNDLCVCVVKPHVVSDKSLGVEVLHGSGGRRMTPDILCFDERSSAGVFEEHFTMTVVEIAEGNHSRCTRQQRHGGFESQSATSNTHKTNIQGHLLPELRI